MEKIRYALSKGFCVARYSCKNVDKKGCNTEPKEGEHFVLCGQYEVRK